MKTPVKLFLIVFTGLLLLSAAGIAQDIFNSQLLCHKYDASQKYWRYQCVNGDYYIAK